MNVTYRFAAALFAAAGLALAVGTIAFADPKPGEKPAGAPEIKLPAGWTEADMQACILAGTPGKMHAELAKSVGTWKGKSTMWMAPGADPMTTECMSTMTSILDGRFIQCEMKSELPGMGPYRGLGFYGYDNVTQKFVANWLDNHGTGIMNGTGEQSSDGMVTTWTYNFHCPITKKPTVMREVQTVTGPSARKLEMYSTDPKSGKEFKMLQIELVKS